MTQSKHPIKKPFDRFLKNKKVIFLDLDGTIYLGDKLITGAKNFLKNLKKQNISYYFLSNNSSCSKKDYVKKLSGLGINATEDDIILSTDGVIAYLIEKKNSRSLCCGHLVHDRIFR